MIFGMTSPSAEYFDQWYADMAVSPTHQDVAIQTLGLPPELESTSLLSWDGIADVTDALGVGPDDVLVDLACGRGGYGLEIARRTGAELIGVVSRQAGPCLIRQADVELLLVGVDVPVPSTPEEFRNALRPFLGGLHHTLSLIHI